jgi:hypothetical protein
MRRSLRIWADDHQGDFGSLLYNYNFADIPEADHRRMRHRVGVLERIDRADLVTLR